MSKIKKWFRSVEESRKKQIIFFCVSMAVIIGLYIPFFSQMRNMRDVNIIKEQQIAYDYEFLYDFESIENQNDKINFKGWAFRLGKTNTRIGIVLSATDGSDEEVLLAGRTERNDVDEYLNTETGQCGFYADIKADKLEKDVCYEVQIAVQYENDIDERVCVRTDTKKYLYNSQVYEYDPTNFVIPQLVEEELVEVITNGTLCTYSMEKRVWIYIHEGRLYCIADANYWVPLEEVPSVPNVFFTLHDELVPEERKEKYDTRGFDSLEIYPTEENYYAGVDAVYCVTSVPLPEYPITYVRTGTYGNRGAGSIFRGTFIMDLSLN